MTAKYFLFGIIGFSATVSPGALLYEPFAYNAEQRLTEGNSSWYLNGSTTNDTYVTAGSLAIGGLSPALGNSIAHGGAGAAVRIGLPTVTSGSLYYSFGLRVDDVGADFTSTTGFIASFVNSASTYEARLMSRAVDADTYNVGVTKVTSSEVVWAPDNFSEGQTLFIVGRYTFNEGDTTDDAVDLWINPDSSTFGTDILPAATLTATLAGTDLTEIAQFTFRQNTAANTPAVLTWDELRIGYSWADVTPVPEPSAWAIWGLGLLCWVGIRRNLKS